VMAKGDLTWNDSEPTRNDSCQPRTTRADAERLGAGPERLVLIQND
jgi:hypothetical protein